MILRAEGQAARHRGLGCAPLPLGSGVSSWAPWTGSSMWSFLFAPNLLSDHRCPGLGWPSGLGEEWGTSISTAEGREEGRGSPPEGGQCNRSPSTGWGEGISLGLTVHLHPEGGVGICPWWKEVGGLSRLGTHTTAQKCKKAGPPEKQPAALCGQ